MANLHYQRSWQEKIILILRPLKSSSRIFFFDCKEKLKLWSCFFSLRTLMIRQLIKFQELPPLTGSQINKRHVANLYKSACVPSCLTWRLKYDSNPLTISGVIMANLHYQRSWQEKIILILRPLKSSSRIFFFDCKEKLKLWSCFFSLRTLMIRQLIKFQELPPLTGSQINKRHVANLYKSACVPSCLTWRLKYKL